MALTLQGRELTDAHRIAQAEAAAKWVSLGSVLTTDLIDPANIDRTAPVWFGAITVLLNQAMAESQALAAAYLPAFRAAEIGDLAELMPLDLAEIDSGAALHRVSLVPAMAKKQIAEEKPGQQAIDDAFWLIAGALQRDVLNVGREVVVGSAEASPISRWRRVTDADPCAFCAMLASRGPAYSSAAAAGFVSGRNLSGSDYRKLRRGGGDVSITGRRGRRTERPLGTKFHSHCGCTIEEVLGPWQPTAREKAVKDLYDAVHEPGDTPEQTLAKMRAKGQGIVRDAHKPETETGGAGGGKKPPRLPGLGGFDDGPRRSLPPGDPRRGKVDRSRVAHVRQHELDTAERLAAHGLDVEFRQESSRREADILIDGVRWELKSPEGGGAQTMRNQLRRGRGQADHLVVDLARTSLDGERAIRDVVEAWRLYPSFQRIVVVHKDGSLEEVRRGD